MFQYIIHRGPAILLIFRSQFCWRRINFKMEEDDLDFMFVQMMRNSSWNTPETMGREIDIAGIAVIDVIVIIVPSSLIYLRFSFRL